MKKFMLIMTMKKFADIRRDYDELAEKRVGLRGTRLPSQRRHLEEILQIYERLDKLFKRKLESKTKFMREWEEKHEVESEVIRLAVRHSLADENDEFLSCTVCEASEKPELDDEMKNKIENCIAQLQHGIDKDKRSAVRELRHFACLSSSIQAEIANQGAIQFLIQALNTGTPFMKQDAACALGNLAFENDDNCEAIASEGGIEPLVELLVGINAQPEYAAYALGRIANQANIEVMIAKGNAVTRLVDLLRSETSLQRWNSAFALSQITTESKNGCGQLQHVQLPTLSSCLITLNRVNLRSQLELRAISPATMTNIALNSLVPHQIWSGCCTNHPCKWSLQYTPWLN